jgi:hypothetical protein
LNDARHLGLGLCRLQSWDGSNETEVIMTKDVERRLLIAIFAIASSVGAFLLLLTHLHQPWIGGPLYMLLFIAGLATSLCLWARGPDQD